MAMDDSLLLRIRVNGWIYTKELSVAFEYLILIVAQRYEGVNNSEV